MEIKSYLLGKQAGGGSTPALQNKSVTITENGTTNVTADTGYDGLGEVEVTTNVGGGGVEDYISSTGNVSSEGGTLASHLYLKIPAITFTGTSLQYAFNYCANVTEIGDITLTSNITSCNSMFNYCASLLAVPNMALDKLSSITNCASMFAACASLKTLPLFDTSHATSLWRFANSSTNLENVPAYDLSSATNFNGMYSGCGKLTDTSLDNILQSCISATSFTGSKTLGYIGIGSWAYPASRIQALPHYQDFINAGWTIGY